MDNVSDALASFASGLLTPARWDDYLRGNLQALTDEEKAGLQVYLDSGCASCHSGASMGGNSYQKLGAFRDWPDQKSDRGRFDVTHEDRDAMYFKVPMLRNVAETGPWFHNGQVKSLDEAVRLMASYQTGQNLSSTDIHLIVAFLQTLTGPVPSGFVQPASGQPAPEATTHSTNPQRGHRSTLLQGD